MKHKVEKYEVILTVPLRFEVRGFDHNHAKQTARRMAEARFGSLPQFPFNIVMVDKIEKEKEEREAEA
jgi:hypothetical protein